MKIYFPNQDKTLEVPEKTRLSEVIREHFGTILRMPCGGGGTCGKCRVRLGNGQTVLACQTFVEPEMTVCLDSAGEQQEQILTCFSSCLLAGTEADPVDPKAPKALTLAFDLGTTTLAASLWRGKDLLAVTSRPNPQAICGADVISRIQFSTNSDAGCRTLQALLLGEVAEMAQELLSMESHQNIHSVSGIRIEKKQESKSSESMKQESKISARFSEIRQIVLAGNTTMEESLAGLDLKSLGAVPFQPSEALKTEYRADDSIWNGGFDAFAPATPIRLFPVISGFVGGDITAGILAIHAAQSSNEEVETEPAFFLDLGTNGEMVLETRDSRFACATAAGPCFEGAKISCGMCAENGAVTHIEDRDGSPFFETCGNAPIRGVCGSALIDLTAALLQLGLLTPDGRLLTPGEIPNSVPMDWASRIEVLAPTSPTFDASTPQKKNSWEICAASSFRITDQYRITQEDFRELQLAVGAIRTGIQLLLRRAGLQASDLAHFRIAGGFGRSVRLTNAQRMGLIPATLRPNAFEFVGNASLAGAVLASLSEVRWKQALLLPQTIQSLDLSQEEGFSDIFMESMFWNEF